MPYVKRKDGKNYLIQSIRRPDGKRGQRHLAYLGQARSVEEAIADLTQKYEIQRKLVRQLARKAAAAKATFQALDWKPPRPWAVKWVDGMPVPVHAQWMASAYSTPVLGYWEATSDRRIAEEAAEKLKARLDKLRRVAADLGRAGAGAG